MSTEHISNKMLQQQ